MKVVHMVCSAQVSSVMARRLHGDVNQLHFKTVCVYLSLVPQGVC